MNELELLTGEEAYILSKNKIASVASSKLDANQGSGNAGKFMVVDNNGDIVPIPGSGGTVIIDDTLSIAGAAAEAKTTGDLIRKKAEASALDKERKRVDALYKLTQGQLWDTEIGDSPAYIQGVEDGGILADVNKIAGRTVVWNQMVGSSKQIPETGETYQKTVPENAVAAEIGSIGGKTVVWNQLAQPRQIQLTLNGVTFTPNSDYSITITGNPTGNAEYSFGARIAMQSGHKILLLGTGFPRADDSNYIRQGFWAYDLDGVFVASNWAYDNDTITTVADSVAYYLSVVRVADGTQLGDGYTFTPIMVDLTSLFGAGSEPQSTSDPRIAAIRAYTETHPEYNAGSLLSAEVTEVQSFRNNWEAIGDAVKNGRASKFFKVGDSVSVNRATAVTATVSGSGLTATVELQDFIEKVGEAKAGNYVFTYGGDGWKLGAKAVTLSDYGITTTGTPTIGQTITVTETVSQETFDVMAVDGYDTPVETGKTHAVSLLSHNVISYNEIPFDPAEALYVVDADTWPDGMPAGTYHIVLDHGCYNGSTVQDGAYEFTTTQLIPVGGKIRHSTIGLYQSTEYTQEQILNGKFTTYNADFSTLESDIATTLGSDGTSIGTTTASDPAYLAGNHINFSQRNSHGNGRWDLCSDRKYLQSKAKGAASGAIASWWYPTGEFDMPVRSTKPGYLYGLDPAFVKVLGAVKKRTALSITDGYGYIDTEDLVWLASMTEVFPTSTTNPVGQKNNNIAETSFGIDGATLQQNCYPYWEGSTNDDYIKYQGTTARGWWLRGPHPSIANGVRYVYASGALNVGYANGTYGVVPGLCIVGGDAAPLDTLEIPVSLRTFLADKGYGWSAGSVYNELNLETKKYIQRVGSVDMGTLTWRYTAGNAFFYSSGVTERAFSENVICSAYHNVGSKSDAAMASIENMSIAPLTFSVEIKIKNTAYTDAATFKSAMSGVMLYYELAEPVEYDISSYLTDDNTLTVEPGGILTFEQDATQLPVPTSLDWTKVAWTETLDSTHKYIYVEDGIETYISGAASQAIAGTDRGLIDLTRMFGAGSEPAGLTEKQSRYALDYRAENPEKNAGELVSATVTDITSFRNFWDWIGYAVKTGTVDKILKPSDLVAVPISSGGAAPVDYNFDVLGIDEDEPVNSALSHVLTIQAHDVLDYGSIPFDPAQYLFAVTAEACTEYGWPVTGMPAGTYNVTLNRGAYDGSTGQDGTYQFTTTQIVPVGGGIRHSQIGVSRSDGDYSKANLLAGTFITYAADRTTTLESGLVTTDGSDGTSLGTTTAKDPTYKVGGYINFSQRQGHGSGRWSTSFLRQYLNSDESTMTFTPATIWSRPMATLPEGFLHKLPAALKAVLGKVRKRYALNISDGYGYEDIEDTVNIVTMLDIGFGKNNGILEGPVSADGTVTRETAYSHWIGATDADRIKYQGTTSRFWLLGSSYLSFADIERLVTRSGALGNDYVHNANGVVPSLHITGNGAAPLDTLEIPSAVRALEGYGQSEVGGSGNVLNLSEGTFTENGHYVDGVWTALDTPVVMDVSSYISADNSLEVETGGTVTFVQSNELKLEVPNEVEYLVNLEEAVGT